MIRGMIPGMDLIIIIPMELKMPNKDTIAGQMNVACFLFVEPLVIEQMNTITLMNYEIKKKSRVR